MIFISLFTFFGEHIVIHNTIDSSFSSYTTVTGALIYDIVSGNHNEIMICGSTLSQPRQYYLSQIYFETISGHNDITASDFTFIARSNSDYPIISETLRNYTLVSYDVTEYTPNEINDTYTYQESWKSDISYWFGNTLELRDLQGSSYHEIDIYLTCSLSGSTAITYSLISNDNEAVPSWVTLDTSDSKLKLITPELSVDTNFTFSVRATVSGDSNTYINKYYLEVLLFIPVWGDGKRSSNETCDDNNDSSGDGWSSDCSTIEDGHIWSGGSSITPDQCQQWSSGYYPNDNKDTWESIWGDGLKVPEEQCDDNNTVSDDGWSPTCVIETGYVCDGGNPNNASDIWTYCNNSEGLYVNDINNPTQWIPHWGDGKRAGNETCDDNNTLSDDGCISDWTQIENPWVCSGGNITTKDVWQYCNSSIGWYRNSETVPELCIPRCNDSKRVGDEKCDDGNNMDGDGWLNDCNTIEDGYVCAGGSSTSVDICELWNSGYYPNDNKDTWEHRWGDGIKVSEEQCEDNNTNPDDGWSSVCQIEDGFACNIENLTISYDEWTYWNNSEGMYQNYLNNPTQCLPQWGDGKRSGDEVCDDGNTSPNDGCNSDWTQVEDSWVCFGGSITTQDSCSIKYTWYYEELGSSPCHYGPQYESTASIVAVQAITGIGIGVGLLGMLFCGTSAQDAWAIISFLQVVLLLPLVVKSMSKTVQDFIVSNAFAALSVYYLPVQAIKSIPWIKDLSFDQQDEYLRVLGWHSGSTVVNNIILLMILFVLAIFHALFCVLYYCTNNSESRCSTKIKKVYKFFTFTVYIRIVVMIYMLVLLLAISEIKFYYKNEGGQIFGHQKGSSSNEVKGNYISLIISCIVLLMLLLFLLHIFISWIINKNNVKINETCKTRELYTVIRKVPKRYLYEERQGGGDEAHHLENSIVVPLSIKVARLYYLIFLIKRIIMVLTAVLIPTSAFAMKIWLLIILQIISISYAVAVRSFVDKKDQIVEMLNEVVILVLTGALLNCYSEEKWTDNITHIFIGIILLQSYTLMIVSMISTIIKCTKLVKGSKNEYYNRSIEQNQNIDQNQNIGQDQNMEQDQNTEHNPTNEVPNLESNEVGDPSFINDMLDRQGTIFPRNLNTFVFNMQTYQNVPEEDKKERNNLQDKNILQ